MNGLFSALAKVFDIHKWPAKYILWLTISSALLVLMPESWATALRIDAFVERYGDCIGIIFIASLTLSFVHLCVWLNSLWSRHKRKKAVHAKLQDLDHQEKAVLREFFLQAKHTIRLPIDEPTVAGLLRQGILQDIGFLAEQSLAGMLKPVRISKIARKKITHALVDLPSTTLTDEQLRELFRKRPNFAATLDQHEYLHHRPLP